MKPSLARLWFIILVLLTIPALLAMTFNIWPGIPVRNNIMHLLPNLRDDQVVRDALEHNNNAMSRKLIILVGSKDKTHTDAAADDIIASMQREAFFDEPLAGVSTEQGLQLGKFFYTWRSQLLSQQQRELLLQKNWSGFEQQLTQTLYSPVSGVSTTLLQHDPLLTFYHYMKSLPTPTGRVQSDGQHLVVHADDRDYRVIIVDIKHDVFDMNFHPDYEAWRNQLEQHLQQQYPDADLLIAGAVEHAVWGATGAKNEVNTIGNGSLLGIIILMLLVFPGWRPLLVSLLPLGAGVIAGLIVTIWCFGDIHLITLVFGSSVIGVAMDYSLHYMSDHYKSSLQDTPAVCLKRIFPGVTFAMITSAIAYAAIGFAPFPILRQIALFSVAGLVMAWFSVVSLYPYVLPAASFKRRWFLEASGAFDHWLRHLFDKPASRYLLVILALAMLPGVWRIHANDDMRLLQAPKKSISATESRLQQLTNIQPSGHYFLVEGSTIEELLQRCEALEDWQHQASTAPTQQPSPDYQIDLMTRYLPSQHRQQENFELQAQLYQQGSSTAPAFAEQWQHTVGIAPEVIREQRKLFLSAPGTFLTYTQLQETSETNPALKQLLARYQLHQTARGFMVTAFVSYSGDSAALRAYATQHPGVHWMDPVADISDLFHHYREQTGWMMAVAYSLIALLLCWRYPIKAALRVLIAPALAAWLTLGTLGYCGVTINLFHVLALLLVLGVGIDYSIFFAETDEHRDTTMLAVLLSTITTILSFGLLALSETAAISSFGVVVSIGLLCSLVFSPLAQYHAAGNKVSA